jgi:non-ribosomal peptide synthetase component F
VSFIFRLEQQPHISRILTTPFDYDIDEHIPPSLRMAAEISVLNDPPSLLGGPQLLHELLNFKKHGARNALDFTRNGKRERYSYREVSSCVELLKLRIQEALDGLTGNNLPSQHIIPILLPQSPGLYISQYAILKSGGAFCPINLDAPKERIKFVVGDISARIIITTTEFKELATWENGPKVIIVEDFPSKEQNISIIEDRCRKATSADLAYVMYTSGSSGTPKGVAVSHRAASQSLMAHDRHIPTFRRFLQFASPSFDVSVFEIFFPLTRGSTLVGCDRSQLLNDLPGIMNELEVDAAELTPTVVGSLLQKRSHVPGLKLLLTIGEMLTKPIIKEFGGSDTTRSILYGMYGPTVGFLVGGFCSTIPIPLKATSNLIP